MSFAHSWEILSALEDKIRIPKRPCNVLIMLSILMKFLHKRQLFFYLFLKQQNSAIKVVTYRKMSVTKILWHSDISYKGEIKTIILIYFLWIFQHHFPRLWQIFLNVLQARKKYQCEIWQLIKKVTSICTIFAPQSHFVNEISKELAACPSGKLSCNRLIMLVTMVTPISDMKDKYSIFTAGDEDMIF